MSISIALPLNKNSTNGFETNDSIFSVVRQNLKMLILTIPGERVMIPDYGVGLKKYLFDSYGEHLSSQIDHKIREQVKKYMPAITIFDIIINKDNLDTSRLNIAISYSIPGIQMKDLLRFTI
tara:strand:+ start:557 stop:922 length:366 start_codon:yes stop_codon:yes gene_type:complete